MNDTELIGFLQTECALFDISVGQEEFSKRFVIWSDETSYPQLAYGTTLREALEDLKSIVERHGRPNGNH